MLETFINRINGGRIAYSLDADARFAASIDNSRFSVMPLLVVYPRSGAEISFVLRASFETETPVSLRGSGTGCSGGAVPLCGEPVIDLSRLDFIKIDPVARTAHVGAGAITSKIDAEASKFGLFYAPDPSSHKYCSIGGNIACNAGGLRAAKYGNTRENILSLTAYLSDGTRLDCARPLKKFSAGFNLRDIFIGSEGSLGVVGEAWLKLLPRPESRKVALAFFDGDDSGFAGIEKAMLSKLQPSVLEFMDSETVSCLRIRFGDSIIPAGASALLVEFDGGSAESGKACRDFLALFPQGNARMAKGAEEAESLWNLRRASSPAMYELGDSKISQDIVLPFESVRDFFAFYKKLGRESGFPTPVFGHAADGNYHIHLMYNSKEKNARKRAWQTMDKAIFKVMELGGAVSGEHGIGFLKSKYMAAQHSQAELEYMLKLKKLFDPKNLLNRGKLNSSIKVSPPLEPLSGIKFSWDKP